MKELPIELLRRLLRYEASTGHLYWLERTPDLFNGGAFHTAQHDANLWNAKHAGKRAFNRQRPDGYFVGCVLNLKFRASRIAWALHYGQWPKGFVDHIDGNPANNRITNLRDVTPAGNNKNMKVNARSGSGIGGVGFHAASGKWRARITVDGRERYLGIFDTQEEAITARRAAESVHGFSGRSLGDA